MKSLKKLLILGMALMGIIIGSNTLLAKDVYPTDWVLYVKKAGNEKFSLSFPQDPNYHLIQNDKKPSTYIRLESQEGRSTYILEVHPLEDWNVLGLDVWDLIIKGQTDYEGVSKKRVARAKTGMKVEGEYIFHLKGRVMKAEVSIMPSGNNLYVFFAKHPKEINCHFEDFYDSFSLIG